MTNLHCSSVAEFRLDRFIHYLGNLALLKIYASGHHKIIRYLGKTKLNSIFFGLYFVQEMIIILKYLDKIL